MTQTPTAQPSTRFGFLSPALCRSIFAALMLLGAILHISYLNHNCPLGLSEDEAHYWDWSRQLGLSYYSKGPMVAYLIRASCAIFGNTMPAVRYPATVLSIGSAILTYWLIVKLFHSDQLALGWTLLSHTVPLFVAGSLLMTIDSPFYFFWALATCFAAKAIFDDRPGFWLLVGVAIGLGFLAKYTMFVWLVGLIPFFILESPARGHLRRGWFWLMFPVAGVFTLPVIIFNAQNHWISLRHVHADTSGGFYWSTIPNFLLGQAAIVGPANFIILVGAFAYIFREARRNPHRRALFYLASIGMTFFAIVMATGLSTRIEPNWPACAYFTLFILAAYFLSQRLPRGPHKWFWRTDLIFSVAIAAVVVPLAHNFQMLYPLINRELPAINDFLAHFGLKHRKMLSNFDPTYKLCGWEQLGDAVADDVKQHPGAIIMGEDYQTASELAFYTPGQPKTYAAGAYFVEHGKRRSQFDIWPDRSLTPDNPAAVGHDAIFVGGMNPTLQNACDSVRQLPTKVIYISGYPMRAFTIWYCHNFHGMARPSGGSF